MSRAKRPTTSDHLHRSKRRRTTTASSPSDAALDRLVPSRNQSPIAATNAVLRDHIHPHQNDSSSEDDNDAPSSQLLFTQPSFVSTQPSTALLPLQSTVKYRKAPSSITSVKDLPPDDQQSFATLLQIFIHRWNIASTLTWASSVILVLKVLLLSSETVISNCLIGM